MTEQQYEALESEFDAIEYSNEVWTEEALARRDEIGAILAKAGRL